MNIAGILCRNIVSSFQHRLLFRYGSISALLTAAAALSSQISSQQLRDEVLEVLTENERDQLWQLGQSASDVQEKLVIFLRSKITCEISINLGVDLIMLLLNLWNILDTYDMLERYREQRVRPYITNEKIEKWNLIYDKAINWATVSKEDRLQAKLNASLEVTHIVEELGNIKAAIKEMEGEKNTRYC